MLNNDSIDGVSSVRGVRSALIEYKLSYDPVSVQDAPEVGLLVHQRLLLGGEHYVLSNGADPEEHGS